MVSKFLTASFCLVAVAFALPNPEEPSSNKRRQYVQPLAGAAQVPRNVQFAAPLAAPAIPVAPAPPVMAAAPVVAMQPAVVAPTGQCPGGPSLPIECDPKRPWPQCPPQSYCYATNSVDIGPYFCCPVWSTYGAAWRPATPFYNYVPPMPANWPDVMKVTANWPAAAVAFPVKARKPVSTQGEEEEESKIGSSINQWMDRQAKL
uniref:Secreted protein n=1 Tax=Haemonchus contortus TaxID=6289 RepID=A0A7I4Y7K6_HAECO